MSRITGIRISDFSGTGGNAAGPCKICKTCKKNNFRRMNGTEFTIISDSAENLK